MSSDPKMRGGARDFRAEIRDKWDDRDAVMELLVAWVCERNCVRADRFSVTPGKKLAEVQFGLLMCRLGGLSVHLRSDVTVFLSCTEELMGGVGLLA